MGLLEREPVLVAQARTLADARAEKGGALFVVAEAGLGKSSVLERAVELAAADFQVGEGCGEEMERMLPFGLLGQALHPLDADFLHGQDGAAGFAIEPSAPYLRFLSWIGDRRGDGPLLLAFDDLHWADEDSLSLIAFLVRRLARFPVASNATPGSYVAATHC